MNHSCVKLLQDSTCVSSYNWVVSRTSNTLPSFRQSLTTFNTSSSKFGLEFGWWKDRPPLLRTTRWPQNYQRITLTIKTPPIPTRLVLLKTCQLSQLKKYEECLGWNSRFNVKLLPNISCQGQLPAAPRPQPDQERLFVPFSGFVASGGFHCYFKP